MQATQTEERAAQDGRQATGSISFQEALPQYLSHLKSYRSYSPLTVQSYRCDLRLTQGRPAFPGNAPLSLAIQDWPDYSSTSFMNLCESFSTPVAVMHTPFSQRKPKSRS